jgi:serine/threonine protein kinase
MGAQNIVHRDLKPENILLNCKDENTLDIRIADLGLAIKMLDGKKEFVKCGTPGYIAPEVLRSDGYDQKADMFAIGVIMYNLLTGKVLFHGSDNVQILIKNHNVDLGNYKHYMRNCSPEAQSLV